MPGAPYPRGRGHVRRDGRRAHLSFDADELRARLLAPEVAARMDAPGKTDAAVLIPIFEGPNGPTALFTERRADLRRHAGEISFPGGRQDEPDEDLRFTALREAHEEVGLEPAAVDVVGALPPVGTFVTGYRVFPFVGLVAPGQAWVAQESEVAQVLELSLSDLVRGYESRRLLRRGVPIKTPTYTVGGHFVWGATARMVEHLLQRLGPLI